MPLAVRADERGWEQTAQTPSASPQAHTPRHARRQARTLRQLVASGCYTSEGLRSSQTFLLLFLLFVLLLLLFLLLLSLLPFWNAACVPGA